VRVEFCVERKNCFVRSSDNVGSGGHTRPGLQNVISVAHAVRKAGTPKNVTLHHGSARLHQSVACEQVDGRGLRRVSYDTDANGYSGGIRQRLRGPTLDLPGRRGGGETPPPSEAEHAIESLPERNSSGDSLPNVLRIEAVVRATLGVDWDKVEPLTLDPTSTPISAEIAPADRRRSRPEQGACPSTWRSCPEEFVSSG